MLRAIDQRVPAAVIVILAVGSRQRKRAHFARSSWSARNAARAHEVGISPLLFGDSSQLVASMLHEAVHAVLHEEGQNGGMGSTGYYHTKVFRDCCREFGLDCQFLNTRYGWTLTDWPNGRTPRRYRDLASYLRAELPLGGNTLPRSRIGGKAPPKSGQLRISCQCRSIYASRSVTEEGGIKCLACGQLFKTKQK